MFSSFVGHPRLAPCGSDLLAQTSLNSAAPVGEYKVAVKFYGSQQNRTRLKNKVYLQVIKGFGTPKETRVQKTLQLKNAGDFQEVMTIER